MSRPKSMRADDGDSRRELRRWRLAVACDGGESPPSAVNVLSSNSQCFRSTGSAAAKEGRAAAAVAVRVRCRGRLKCTARERSQCLKKVGRSTSIGSVATRGEDRLDIPGVCSSVCVRVHVIHLRGQSVGEPKPFRAHFCCLTFTALCCLRWAHGSPRPEGAEGRRCFGRVHFVVLRHEVEEQRSVRALSSPAGFMTIGTARYNGRGGAALQFTAGYSMGYSSLWWTSPHWMIR